MKKPSCTSVQKGLAFRSRCNGFLFRPDTYPLVEFAAPFKRNVPVYLGEQCIVLANAHIQARPDLGAALPDNDTAGTDILSIVTLDTQPLGNRITAVFGAARAFLLGKQLQI